MSNLYVCGYIITKHNNRYTVKSYYSNDYRAINYFKIAQLFAPPKPFVDRAGVGYVIHTSSIFESEKIYLKIFDEKITYLFSRKHILIGALPYVSKCIENNFKYDTENVDKNIKISVRVLVDMIQQFTEQLYGFNIRCITKFGKSILIHTMQIANALIVMQRMKCITKVITYIHYTPTNINYDIFHIKIHKKHKILKRIKEN